MSFLARTLKSMNGVISHARGINTTAVAPSALKKWAYNLSGFNQYGLHHDDVLNDMDEDVEEAVRRLPQHLVDERNFRIIRAQQLSIQKTVLPKEQWTKWEDDVRYLDPYLEEVRREKAEQEEWNKS